jgi:GNAT superfamily N-acetyltransferase
VINRRLAKYLVDLESFPRDAALGYRLDGMRGLWDAVAPRTIDRVYRTGHMVIFAQLLDDAPVIPAPHGVTIRGIEPEDWAPLSGMVMQRTLARFRALVAAGRHGLVAWRGAKPIGYGWVAERIAPDVSVCPLALPPYAAYLWDLYVVPEERSNGVGSALASARIRKARELGFREGWRMISPSNAPSLRTLANTGKGVRIVGEMRYVKLLNRMHSQFTPARA